MVQKEDLPAVAFCPLCREPRRVVDISIEAAEFGLNLPKGTYVFECCEGSELTIEDNVAARELQEMLIKYHRDKEDKESGK